MTFSAVDLHSPLDVETLLAAAPEGCTFRGMFLGAVADQVRAAGGELPSKRYIAFSSYPLEDFVRLCMQASETLYPGRPLRYGLYQIGKQAYPVFVSSTVGKVLFAMAGSSFDRALDLVGRAYEHATSPGSAQVVREADQRAVVQLRDLWSFPDCYHVGVFAGGYDAYGVRGEVRVRPLSPCDADLELRWS